MAEQYGENVRRESGILVWFEPVEPLGGVGHVVMTTRLGGGSRPPYEGLNLGMHVGDVEERVRLNRRALLQGLGQKLREPVVGEQVHGAVSRTVGELHAGTRWERNEPALEGTDALVTATRYLPLVTLVADCLPVALVDPGRGVGAVVHAGWRGLAAGVVDNALATMKRTWGTFAPDVVAWAGPAIGPCCYEVGPEVAERFPEDAAPSGEGRARLDLRAALCRRLAAAGLLEENVTGLDLCTACRPELFFSHRRATREGAAATGRQALILWLGPAPLSGSAADPLSLGL
jgi:polyphenol oxidase